MAPDWRAGFAALEKQRQGGNAADAEAGGEGWLLLGIHLVDLVEGMPPEHGSLGFVRGVNNHGSMFGYALTPDFFSFSFLLERTGSGGE